MGYDAPDGFSDVRIANPPLPARDGGALLAGDVNSLGVTHVRAGAPNITVLGHSYGSTTVADAFAGSGMKASNAVLIGCPGTDLAQDAGDFNLQGGQVYVGNASTDPVGWIGASDSSRRYHQRAGGRTARIVGRPRKRPVRGILWCDVRFHAEVPGSGFLDTDDHSSYYTMGSESLYSMAAISSGHGRCAGGAGHARRGAGSLTVSTPDKIDTPFGENRPAEDRGCRCRPEVVDPEVGTRPRLDHVRPQVRRNQPGIGR